MKHKAKHRPVQNPIYTFQIEAFSHEGRGIAHYGTHPDHPKEKHGKKVFIRYALVGETVQAKVTHQTSRLEEAEMVKLESEPAASRIDPICQHFGTCGGCSLQHIDPTEQIRLKQNVLQSHLQHFAGLQPEQWLEPIRATKTDYRRRARIGVRYIAKQNRLVMGFREHHSNHLTAIQQCKVLDQTLSDALPELRKLLESLTGKAHIGHIELAMGDNEVALLIRHLDELNVSDVNQLRQFSLLRGWQLYFQPKGIESLHRVDDSQAEMRLHYSLDDFAVKFAFSPLDFTQVNSEVNARMVHLACELLNLQEGERVLDLFCGLGNFSLPLARCVGETGQVVGVEASDEMVHRATENAKANQCTQAVFFSQDLTKDFSHHSWAKQGFDALLIDPPRSGAFEVMQYVPNFGAKRIVYVSCNPSTLARDAGVLAQYGYQLKKAAVMDMFTHTEHVESIALFEKNEQLEKIEEIND
ncbi:23S rRNA (uracil(1939)-C(5))-methyltransferase RlmD [Acinetobacter venetianus]|uniref:23S rRNA (uracil(1939)-C(5))-methyltransferase RlmD n=1 Tax=Acinetobacter venetianus TaxID=52133 RepID=UPI0010A5CFAE|nr:23S rRNA (uracil(1939)-C(5))-methyltransferase RlmD [Acinetobacter venetianus]MCR4531308.1 23S rRNA (uracil(1939)-C(5))-methyltransferase RlmD [Acinetobacter venetianus]MDA0695570.1 23S rRNA (uracil(1939)-C(5))-methyltransferase RlmD [Pseudomonadota bacterium]MDA1253199.1 23S rRNA (uracil(1939)-C(5))-methyltransferase RlmD [Pseudomonadota bacterium]